MVADTAIKVGMSILDRIGKKGSLFALFPFFLFITACTSTCTEWSVHQDCSATPCYQSLKISYRPCNQYREIQFDLIKSKEGCHGYFVVHCIPLAPLKAEGLSLPATIKVKNETISFETEMFHGAQRTLLPDCITCRIIKELLTGNDIEIHLGRYHSTLKSCGFLSAYKHIPK